MKHQKQRSKRSKSVSCANKSRTEREREREKIPKTVLVFCFRFSVYLGSRNSQQGFFLCACFRKGRKQERGSEGKRSLVSVLQ